jgi:hypothetical protein
LTAEAVDNWADVDNLPVRRAVPPGYVGVLGDDEGFGVELDDGEPDDCELDDGELDDAVASSFEPSVPLFDDLGFEPFDPLLCALLSVR